MKLKALIPMLAFAAAGPVSGADDTVSHPVVRTAPAPIAGAPGKETYRYTAIAKDGTRVPLGKTERSFTPSRKAFEREAADARDRRQTVRGQRARMIVRDTYTDGRAPTTREVYPSDHAARQERNRRRR